MNSLQLFRLDFQYFSHLHTLRSGLIFYVLNTLRKTSGEGGGPHLVSLEAGAEDYFNPDEGQFL
jgi:hypothetical protein